MQGGTILLSAIDAIARETMLFAAAGFLIGGIDDLAIDLLYCVQRGMRRLRPGPAAPDGAFQAAATGGGRFAIFIPAWDEQAVIGAMLKHLLATIDHDDYRVYVGAYPNDRATIDAVAAVAMVDHRVRMVIGSAPGPTTKADCLNSLWRALERDRAAEGVAVRAVVLHDAEDVVHADELRVFDALLGRYATVQLPVLPLVNRRSQLVAGHYLDEFAEAHAKQLVVRQMLGASLPLAGVGCAIACPMLARIAQGRPDGPFDADSLTEDYELGLKVAALGGRGVLARVRPVPGAPLVAVRAYFPAALDAAVRQKARWMTGIALAGWDRIGWAHWHRLGEHWMLMRDRRAPLAVLVMGAAYLALMAGGAALLGHALLGGSLPIAPPRWLLMANGLLLGWRLAMRAAFTGLAYGPGQALLSGPRMVVGNIIAMLAARRALGQYLALLRGKALRWDKTVHVFPDLTTLQS